MLSDPISDVLTRIRNAIHAKHDLVQVMYSKLNLSLLRILEKSGYVESVEVVGDEKKKNIQVVLRYFNQKNKKEPVLTELHRISRPGRRVYSTSEEIKPVLGGLGVSVLSTSKGLLTDQEARKMKIGGEVLCKVW